MELASPHPRVSWNEDGRRRNFTPSQQADLQISLAKVAERQGNLEGAEAGYRAALKRDKSRADAHLYLANLCTLNGDYRQAEDRYRKALEANPGNADVFCDMGYSLYLQRKWDGAERNLKQALAIQPAHRRAHNNLALVLAHAGRSEEALAEFRKAGNSPTDSHLNLAFSHSLERRWQAAREECRLALATNPSSEIAKSRLRELDHAIAMNESRLPKTDAPRDTNAVPASSITSTAAPRREPVGSKGGGVKAKKIPPPYTLRTTPAQVPAR
jgi:Flp pilus assembly protein TadD